MDEQAKIPRSLIDQLFDLGVMGIEIPESLRRRPAARFFHSVLAVEELSRVDPSVGVLVDVQNTLVVNALLRWGNDDIRRRYLPKLAAKTVGAYALSEAGSGSDAFALTTRAREDGDGYVLSGRKLWITNGNEADLFIVFATVNPDAGYRGITAFLVERGCRRVYGRQERRQARHPRQQHVRADPRRLPRAARERARRGRQGLQDRHRDAQRRTHRHRRADDRPRHGARCEHAIAYTKERKQFGKPIAEFQAVQHQLARAAVDVEAATLTVYNAARLRDAGRPFLTEAAICKIFSSEVAERVASLAVNLFGGNGFVKEYPVEKLYRDAKIGQIYEGTSNLQLQTIAKQILS